MKQKIVLAFLLAITVLAVFGCKGIGQAVETGSRPAAVEQSVPVPAAIEPQASVSAEVEPLTVVESPPASAAIEPLAEVEQPAPVPLPDAAIAPVSAVKTNPVPEMIRIQGGTFIMGSPANEPGRESYETQRHYEIQHQVTVSSFYMGKYPVTQKEYQKVMGTNPSKFKGDDLPVECVSWYDAVEFCNKLSEKEGFTSAYTIDKSRKDPNNISNYDNFKWIVTWNRNANGYRLPTEAEWEYACRAGTTTAFNTGDNITTDQANYDGNRPYNGNAKGEYRRKTTPVGSFAANDWGLYDMHGNVCEYCWDWHGDYASDAQTDPVGNVYSIFRMVRGGSWKYAERDLRSAARAFICQYDKNNSHYGFRLVRGE